MAKIKKLLDSLKQNNPDKNKGINDAESGYLDVCLEIHTLGNLEHIPYIMGSMKDWKFNQSLIYYVSDLILGYSHIDTKKMLNIFLQNIELMYPQAQKGLKYIIQHFLSEEKFKPYVYENFVKLSLEQKRIFKEIYLLIVEEDREYFCIPEIDEALNQSNNTPPLALDMQ